MEDYYEYLDSNGVTTLYKLIKDDTVALIDSYSVTINGITTNLDNHVNNADIHTPIATIEGMIDTAIGSLNYATPDYVDTKVADLVNSSPETLDTLKELSDALGNDSNFATTVANQIGSKADKDDVYTKQDTDTLLEGKANSVHSHVVSDITDFPTIPTKTSQLINDSGFLTSSNGLITSVSWSDITNKPNFSTVATSGSYTDLSNTPTIPTKVSQLENDMGFGTGGDTSDCVHKTGNEIINGIKTFNDTVVQKKDGIIKNDNVDITTTPLSNLFTHLFFSDKNNVANAFIRYGQRTNGINELNLFVRDKDSNNYGVSVNTNNEFIPVLNNIYSLGSAGAKWKKIYSDDVVHTSGNEYIGGIKSFSSVVYLLDNIINKNNQVDLTVTPTSNLYTHYLFVDKNGKTTAYTQHGKQTTGTDFIGLFVKDKSENLIGVELTTNKEFIPFYNNTYNLGSPNNKWANAYIDRVVCTRFTHSVNNGSVYISGGSEYDKGATLVLHGEESNDAGTFIINSRDKTRSLYLIGRPDGTLQWAGQNIALDVNLVHRSGHEAISGVKSFNNLMYIYDNMSNKNSQMDLFTTPANTLYAHYMFVDKNNEVCAYMQYGQQNTGTDFIGLFIHDKKRALHGLQVTTNNEVIPLSNNTYSLGSSGLKWANVYATNTITYSVKNHNDTSTMTVCGGSSWDKGSTLFLYGNSHANYPGAFDLTAKNTTNEIKLIGFPNGALTWGGNNLTTTTFVKGTNYWYRKHSDGFIEMGGIGNASIMESTNKVTLPTPFSNTNYVVTGSSTFRADIVFGVSSKTTTYFYCGLSQPGITWATGTFSWYACGY